MKGELFMTNGSEQMVMPVAPMYSGYGNGGFGNGGNAVTSSELSSQLGNQQLCSHYQ